jgi:hypothetical protein
VDYVAPGSIPSPNPFLITVSSCTALTTLCRNSTTHPGWPASQPCVVPAVNVQFSTRTQTAP